MAIFLPSLKKNGHLDQIHLTICNVGSRKISEHDEYSEGVWQYFPPNLSIYGFDADSEACEEANAALEAKQVSWTEKHIPLAISNAEGESTLYVTKHPMCSSLYPPNESFLARFAMIPELMNLDFTVEIETITLDSACEREGIEEIDFLQVDVQGADLKVLEGADHLLSKSILGIQIEVEFVPLYEKQPLFRDVDVYLERYGFSLFDLLTAHKTRARSPICSSRRAGQLLWGDAIYFRDLIRDDLGNSLKTPQKIFKLACLADALQFPDYALELLEYLTLNHSADDQQFNFAPAIMDAFSQIPEIVEQGLETLPTIRNLQDYLPSHQ
jgi:FkbM family methyltransferase